MKSGSGENDDDVCGVDNNPRIRSNEFKNLINTQYAPFNVRICLNPSNSGSQLQPRSSLMQPNLS